MTRDLSRVQRAVLAGEWGPGIGIDEPMSNHTSYRIGGRADVFAVADTHDRLVELVSRARSECIPYIVLGNGTNVLVADAGIRGLVIRNQCRGIERINGEVLLARAGETLSDLARHSVELGLRGLEWGIDIPGTLGGAVIGNAGAYGGYIGDVLRRVLVVNTQGNTEWIVAEELDLGYRTSRFKRLKAVGRDCPTVLCAEIMLAPASSEELRQLSADYTRRRQDRQPWEPSAGSVFKRTAKYPAGFLVEKVGLKGLRIGDAQISSKHANFIVNLGEARASEVRALIDVCRERVLQDFGVELELEIELVGEW